ncbi:bifunctional UDP-sugar hydrolase/5'-nucleotidase [Apilactobacillus sp. EABW-1NA]|uniref:bifunctional metallophosphatase/5'-nucleotidase n=1 Tax=Apilactobacillus sp. EABW-1NA TaxID=2984137 RepID=UPI0025B18D8B|nr:bifunctional UDP-sugar hydrolase/5'-nucleotidase [Apilactobacillus sp. EABW-1NA]MDN2612072.1 bifunctional metallophosphatase/5'-nucleotidase [Apilactobacillus sp. EABW-1NA]
MKINLLETSDTHGFLFPTNYVNLKDDKPFGMLRCATAIKDLRTRLDNVVAIDNGDFLQGSALAYYIAEIKKQSAPKQINDTFNAVDYDFGVLGNHEFNYGLSYLHNTINESTRHFLCANIIDQDGNHPFGNPYEIKDINGVKVGFLGLTTQGTTKWEKNSHLAGLTFLSAKDTAAKYIPEMAEKTDLNVIVYHGGIERDEEGVPTEVLNGENETYDILAHVKGVDAIITGHQHRKIAGHLLGVPIIQPGHRGQYIGHIELDVQQDDNGKYFVQSSESELIPTKKYPVDHEIADKLNDIQEQINKWLDEPMAHIEGSMDFDNAFEARLHKTSFIQFIQNIQMQTMGVDISATALFNDEAHGFENPITMRNIITNYVYPNSLSVLKITGAELKAAMETSAKYFDYQNGKIGVNHDYIFPKLKHYNYDMYEGVDYVINVAKPVGHRIEDLTYHGKPIDDDAELKIVLNIYRAVGGGNYQMFSQDKIIKSDDRMMSQLIADYLREHKTIKAENNHNFKVIYRP